MGPYEYFVVNFSLFDGLKASVLVRAFRVCVEIKVSIVRFLTIPSGLAV
jgi:hypothetical protein